MRPWRSIANGASPQPDDGDELVGDEVVEGVVELPRGSCQRRSLCDVGWQVRVEPRESGCGKSASHDPEVASRSRPSLMLLVMSSGHRRSS